MIVILQVLFTLMIASRTVRELSIVLGADLAPEKRLADQRNDAERFGFRFASAFSALMWAGLLAFIWR